jgi:hypothetical protein
MTSCRFSLAVSFDASEKHAAFIFWSEPGQYPPKRQVSTLRNARSIPSETPRQSRIFTRRKNVGEQHVSNTRYQNSKFSKAYSFPYKTSHMCFSLLMTLTSYNSATGLCSGCQILYTPSTQPTCCCCTSQFGCRHLTKVTPVNCSAPQSAAKARQYVSHKAHFPRSPVACLPATPALGLQVK